MTRENIVACPACDAEIDAVAVICRLGACPECDTPASRHDYTPAEAARDDSPPTLFEIAGDDPERSPEQIIDDNHAFEVDA